MRGVATEVVIDAPISFTTNRIDHQVHRLGVARLLVGSAAITGDSFSYDGIVSGTGSVRVRASGSATIVAIVAQINAPWYVGGALTESVASALFTANWRHNLARFKLSTEKQWARSRRQKAVEQ